MIIMELLNYLIMVSMVASAFSGYLTVRAKHVERDIIKTLRFMYLTVFLTIVWIVLVLFS